MTESTATAAAPWLTELDDIDISWNTTAFAHSHLGKIPLELLDLIVEYVPTSNLLAVACIRPVLRDLSEKYLYTCIDLSNKSDQVWPAPPRKDSLWALYRTLECRPDLARAIKKFSVQLFDQEIFVDTDTSTLFRGDTQLAMAAQVSLQHILIGGRILQHVTDVEDLYVEISRSSGWSGRREEMAPDLLAHLLPAFDRVTAHVFQHPGLQKVTRLEFGGAEFHWVLAKSPCLRELHLARPCDILSDGASDEVSPTLKVLTMTARSTILRKNSHRYAHFSSFLAHFPSLEELTVRIFDLDVD